MTEYSLRRKTPLKRHRVFYIDVAAKSLELKAAQHLSQATGAENGDVVIFADNYLLVLGVTGKLHSCLPEKSALIVIEKTDEARLLINAANLKFSANFDDVRKFIALFKEEKIGVEFEDVLYLLSGPIDEIFHDCNLLQKKFNVKWITYSKANHTFSEVGWWTRNVTEDKSLFEVSKFLLRRQILTDIWLAMSSLQLPDYVMLEIIDWLKLLLYDDHREKIGLIQGLSRSRRKIKDQQLHTV